MVHWLIADGSGDTGGSSGEREMGIDRRRERQGKERETLREIEGEGECTGMTQT